MRTGDTVIVSHDPGLWGTGLVVQVRRDGHLLVRFPDGACELFSAHELEPARGPLRDAA
jgi:hypothetical protein